MTKDEPTIEIGVHWAGEPPKGVPSKVTLTKKHFDGIRKIAAQLHKTCENCAYFWLMDTADESGDLLGRDPVCDDGHNDIVGEFGFVAGVKCSSWKQREGKPE